LQDVVGPDIRLVDSAITVAEQAARTLTEMGIANDGRSLPTYCYTVTDIPLRFQTIGERFLGARSAREQGGLVNQHLIPDEVVYGALQVRLPPHTSVKLRISPDLAGAVRLKPDPQSGPVSRPTASLRRSCASATARRPGRRPG
jgi:hypothetical protein